MVWSGVLMTALDDAGGLGVSVLGVGAGGSCAGVLFSAFAARLDSGTGHLGVVILSWGGEALGDV